MKLMTSAIAFACAFAATSPAFADHFADQHVGQQIGPILGSFGTGSGTFTGSQTQDALMPYVFYGSAGQTINANTFGSNYDTGLSLLFKGNTNIVASDIVGGNLAILDENDDVGVGLQSALQFTLANTGYYALTVGGFGGSTGTYVLNLEGGSVFPGVPEPATWALMIAGFGLVGAALRRRQTVSVTYA